MNRRKFLCSLSSLSTVGLLFPSSFLLDQEARSTGVIDGGDRERSQDATQEKSHSKIRIGIVGVVGQGVFHLDRVAQEVQYPCKKIAIETNVDRLRWCHPEHAILISDLGSHPTTVRDAQLMARDRKSEISRQLANLDLAFLLTGQNGAVGRGVTSVVAEALGELGVFTVAVSPRIQEDAAIASLRALTDVVFQVSERALMAKAQEIHKHRWFDLYFRRLVPEAMGSIVRMTSSFALDQNAGTPVDSWPE
jgi:hypothetical protein